MFPTTSSSAHSTSAGHPDSAGEPPASASGHQTEVDELADDDSDDDDMEDVVVPLHPRPDAVRT